MRSLEKAQAEVGKVECANPGGGGKQAEQNREIKFILWAESDLNGPDNKMETFDFEMTKGNTGLFFIFLRSAPLSPIFHYMFFKIIWLY